MLERLASDLGFTTNDQLLRSLMVNAVELEILTEAFAEMLSENSFLVCSFQEARPIVGNRKV